MCRISRTAKCEKEIADFSSGSPFRALVLEQGLDEAGAIGVGAFKNPLKGMGGHVGATGGFCCSSHSYYSARRASQTALVADLLQLSALH